MVCPDADLLKNGRREHVQRCVRHEGSQGPGVLRKISHGLGRALHSGWDWAWQHCPRGSESSRWSIHQHQRRTGGFDTDCGLLVLHDAILFASQAKKPKEQKL